MSTSNTHTARLARLEAQLATLDHALGFVMDRIRLDITVSSPLAFTPTSTQQRTLREAYVTHCQEEPVNTRARLDAAASQEDQTEAATDARGPRPARNHGGAARLDAREP